MVKRIGIVAEVMSLNAVINGIDTNYVTVGQGEAVLLLHGWGSSLDAYRQLIQLLSQKYFVIALDMPGFGKTEEPPRPFDVDDYVDFVLEFMKQFPVSKLSLVGHSFGGRVIIKMANRQLPFGIDKIVLIDSAGIKPQPSKKKSTKQLCYKIGKWFATRKLIAKLFPGFLEKLRVTFGSADYAAASPMMRQCLVKVVNEDLSHLLPGIKAPTLLVWGENDTATPLADAKKMEAAIPDAGLAVIKNAGHFSFVEQPVIFRSIMASFFKIG
jgi:pimeloyl-ACP methyl ester carboxylesterase